MKNSDIGVYIGELTKLHKLYSDHDPVGFMYTITSICIYIGLFHSVFELINTLFTYVYKYLCVCLSIDYNW